MNTNITKNSKSNKSLTLAWVLTVLLAVTLSSPAMAQLYDWTKLDPAEVPPGRDDHMMAFDSTNGVVVMFGGDKGGSSTWYFNGKNWKDIGVVGGPAPRRESAMVYDSKRKMIVMYGGWDFTMDTILTWQFDGEKWFPRAEEDDPVGRSDHAMAFDEARGVTVMFGGEGITPETWTFDGKDWEIALAATGFNPDQRWGHAMAYDSKREVVVLFGGFTDAPMDDTWEWDGSEWKQIETALKPPALREHAMVYDSARNVIVLFGGRAASPDGYDQTWEYDGVNWVQRGPVEGTPGQRHEVAMAFDSWRSKVVLFGGSTGSLNDTRYMSDTWWYPNVPPVIYHKPEEAIAPEKDRTITAKIEDVDQDAIEVHLYYRMAGESKYSSLTMSPTSNNRFSAVIPGSAIIEGTLEYYIRALDLEGSKAYGYGANATSPFKVIVARYGSLKVRIGNKIARKKGAKWTTFEIDDNTWHKAGFVLEDLKPGEVQIKFITLDKFKKPPIQKVTIRRGFETEISVEYTKK